MAKKSPPPADDAAGPTPIQTKKLPEKLGGEVRMYDIRQKALPDVVNPPPEKEAAQWHWWAVHFPSRRCAPVKSNDRTEPLRIMKQYMRGIDELDLVPKPKAKRVPPRARARETGKREAGKQAAQAERLGFTAVPEGMDFDQAMGHVFPVERITQQFERLLHATEVVYDREGNETGERPAFTVQFQTLKALTEWHIGRPREKEKKLETKPQLSVTDLRRKLMMSPQYRDAFREMLEDVEREVKQSAGAPPAMQPPARA